MTTTELIDALNWRYATKLFDPTRKIPAATWAALEESLVLTPSSFGLQPWKFFIVQNQELREQLVPHTWRQRQVADCSHLVVMAVTKSPDMENVDSFITRMAEVRGGTADSLAGFRKMLAGIHGQGYMTKDWAKMQAYIALGQFMTACALLGIDTCPMEGIDAAAYDRVLGLDGTPYATRVACTAGHRSPLDKYAAAAKVRFAADEVVEHR